MTHHSNTLAWRIPGMGEPGGLPSMGSHSVGHDWRSLAAAAVIGITIEVIHSNSTTYDALWGYTYFYQLCIVEYFLTKLNDRLTLQLRDFHSNQVALVVKNHTANEGDIREAGSISGLGRSPGGGYGNPLQYSCLENPLGQRSLGGYNP